MTSDNSAVLLNLNWEPANQAAARVLELLKVPVAETQLHLLQLAVEFYPRADEGDAGEDRPELAGLLDLQAQTPAQAWAVLKNFPLDQVESVQTSAEAAELAQAVAAECLPAEALVRD